VKLNLLFVAVTLVLALAVACGDAFRADDGGTGAGSTGESCTHVSDCTAPSDPCVDVSCQNNNCVLNTKKNGTPLPAAAQDIGDCSVKLCLGGAVQNGRDDDDAPSGDDCTSWVCGESGPEAVLAEVNTPCGDGGALACNEQGVCVGCTTSDDCGGCGPCCLPKCQNQECKPDPLVNQMQPPDHQTDGDCATAWCNAEGLPVYQVDLADLPDDPTAGDCTIPACKSRGPTFELVDNGAACPDLPNQTCCNGVCCSLGLTCDANMMTCTETVPQTTTGN
jgi:hypothetical protein